MESVSQTWFDRVRVRLDELATRPALLFVLLVTANALARPYANFAHDARVYSVQVLNQMEPGSYADDLFLKYGSQDQFSLFSRVVAPIAAVIGLAAAFFLLYLVINGLFLLGLQRLVLKLVPDRSLAVLGLIYLAVAPLPFGGLNVFQVHEPFLTPRILANALVLFGLERLLSGRPWWSLTLMFAAALMHPLMAQAGLAIWVLVRAWDGLPRAAFYGLLALGALAKAALVFFPALGTTLFGPMDAEWHHLVRLMSTYNFLDEWELRDWLHLLVSVLVLVGAAYSLRAEHPDRARFLALTTLACVAGLLGTLIGSEMGYAFLFQAQPYRIVWVAKALQAPLALWLAARLWTAPRLLPRLTAMGLVLLLWCNSGQPLELAFLLFVLPILVLGFRGLEAQPRRSDWLASSLLATLVAGCLGWGMYKIHLILSNADTFASLLDPLDFGRLLLTNLGPMVLTLTALALAGFLLARPSGGRVGLTLGLALACQLFFFIVPNLPAYRLQATRHEGHLKHLAEFLDSRRRPDQPRPTLYCSLGRIDYLWIDLRTNSYFDWAQIVGCMFNRGNAEEGQRRALLVRAFEVERFREGLVFLPEFKRRALGRFFQADLETLSPTQADLERLCLEEDIDFVILKQEFPGLVTRSFGPVHLYDCREIRLTLSGPTGSVLAANRDVRPSPRATPASFQP